jgi:DMSO/TMAO reductase YedYZ heme-binding membrane subunit
MPPITLLPSLLHRAPDLSDDIAMVLGYDAALCLVACIAVTPLLTIVKTRAAKLRWWYGIWMFILSGMLLLGTELLGADPGMAAAGNAQDWTGTVIVLLLFPMAVTANTAAQKLLGPEWKRWQRWLMWTVYGLTVIHLAALYSWDALAGLLLSTVPLIALRNPRVRSSVKAWRAGRYETGGWWIGIAVLAAVWLTGLTILLTLTVMACVSAVN